MNCKQKILIIKCDCGLSFIWKFSYALQTNQVSELEL